MNIEEKALMAEIRGRIQALKEMNRLPDVLLGAGPEHVKEHFLRLWRKNRRAARRFLRQAAGNSAEKAEALWTDEGIKTAAKNNSFGLNVGV